MSDSTMSPRPEDAGRGQGGPARPLRVAKAIPSAPTTPPAQQKPAAGTTGGLARPIVISGGAPQSDADMDFDADRAVTRPRRHEKKKSPIAGWQIAVLAIVGIAVMGGAIALMLSQESRTDETVVKAAPAVPQVPVAPAVAAKVPEPPISSRKPSPPADKPKTSKLVKEIVDPELKPIEPLPETPLPAALASNDSGSGGLTEPPRPETQPTTQSTGESKPPIRAENPEYSDDYLKGRSYRREAEERTYPLQKPVVDAGLNWLARHQLADGGWAFEHRVGECRGRCPNPGDLLKARVAATGFALLPFLGAGHSHLEGQYRRNVAGGLKFIMANQGPRGGMVEAGGRMYGHGIATLALCEAFGVAGQKGPQQVPQNELPSASTANLTPEQKKALAFEKKLDKALQIDPRALRDAARRALLVIINGQHPQGGWRYQPGEAGDMSVVGWQIMALASGQQAGFGFDRGVRDRALNFMRLCGGSYQGDQNYGVIPTRFAYMPPGQEKHAPTVTNATTAIGLLSLIYMGVHPQHPGMQVAVQRLQQQGPNAGDMYYTYYANQVMYQNGGQPWENWKLQIEQMLRGSQAKMDHLEGSWFLGGDHGSTQGGRVYCTVMALLCLEENYRHMRIFKNAIGNQGQPGGPNNVAGAPANNAAALPANNGQPAVANPPVVNPAFQPGAAPQFPLAAPQPGDGGGNQAGINNGDNLPQAGFNNSEPPTQDLKPIDPGAQ